MGDAYVAPDHRLHGANPPISVRFTLPIRFILTIARDEHGVTVPLVKALAEGGEGPDRIPGDDATKAEKETNMSMGANDAISDAKAALDAQSGGGDSDSGSGGDDGGE